ncbi:2Fe-2S iron-sulfur cluster binding domain-containing protein [Rhodoblastus acidophilus]|uniref:2Fe-2S iron-sulfur cluster binding domain-containing protein n=1 Tax=Candidatus Rhodoblastus alkanivorans TaxID=2954117 RepID=A0ABS9Z3W2_9HYPH|nr:2Fe-2S iron-sulfur cluster binding domain-containing protein [Candidatus Rhodoblastus alkanivorans]MCI4679977.1 2Fe-2S iron-sulfur cluster binding domain-containing protein [Candidatus Rhodoblastus alkanivorans]MCI4682360.1 2Fe-2S iron-sulfur cluster binding domain-containing protein [Candidatus Rhodoblastus alkanivorans]MDI4639663.1 2Fe-2S iron-sulfur cluster binding domain-containing protein [Rhodoblastus acidophilus]
METNGERGARDAANGSASVSVTIAETGETFLNDSRHSILESMRRLGKRGVPVGCRSGGCSVCKIEILQGSWRQCRPMSREYVSDDDLDAGRVLACCIAPTENMILRVLGKMRKALERPSPAKTEHQQ